MNAMEKLIELDDRHNELLDQLAQLDKKIAETLNEWTCETAGQSHSLGEDNSSHLPTLRVKSA